MHEDPARFRWRRWSIAGAVEVGLAVGIIAEVRAILAGTTGSSESSP
jgi:hypothetical protein